MSKPIHQEIDFKASPKRIYEALMNDKEHGEFTGGPAKISRDVGGAFSCHGGMVVGRNVELIPNERIVQAWRIGDWDDGDYSIVRPASRKERRSILRVGGTKCIGSHCGVIWPRIRRKSSIVLSSIAVMIKRIL